MRKAILLAVLACWLLLAQGALAEDGRPLEVKAPQASLCVPDQAREGELLAGQGCCSHHRGQCGCEGGRVVCCDGSYSPSCSCEKDSGPVN